MPPAGIGRNGLVEVPRILKPRVVRHKKPAAPEEPVTVAKDPVSGRGNLGYNRMERLDDKTFGFNVNE